MTRAEQHRQAVRRVYRSLKRTPRLSSPPTGTNRPVWRWPSLNAIAIPGANWPHPFVMKTRAPIRWKGLFWDMHHNWNTEKASNLNESVFTTHKLKTTFPNERYHFHPISNKKKSGGIMFVNRAALGQPYCEMQASRSAAILASIEDLSLSMDSQQHTHPDIPSRLGTQVWTV